MQVRHVFSIALTLLVATPFFPHQSWAGTARVEGGVCQISAPDAWKVRMANAVVDIASSPSPISKEVNVSLSLINGYGSMAFSKNTWASSVKVVRTVEVSPTRWWVEVEPGTVTRKEGKRVFMLVQGDKSRSCVLNLHFNANAEEDAMMVARSVQMAP